jgi:4-phospho-D-threonate 3-dehydrogenase / 4-phospho-D-erythronate 3-dehydrogenase
MHSKPLILITMGDPNGVGPEVSLKAAHHFLNTSDFRLLIVGSANVLKQVASIVNVKSDLIVSVTSPEEVDDRSVLFVCDGGTPFNSPLKIGQVCPEAGLASIEWVKQAVLWIQAGRASAMATAPICKEAIEPHVPGFQGHTEYIGEMCGDPEPVLCLVHGDWVAAHVSTHVSLRDACDRVTKPRILKTARLLNHFLKQLKGLNSPKIGVAGLNPHAGEGGLFGCEEIDVINPTVHELKSEGLNIFGAIPGDVVFPQLKAGAYDGVVAMYHDQGHVVTKTLAFDLGKSRSLRGVNLTLGIDVIRTSVDHGTGFDIAHQNICDHHSLIDALLVAYKMTLKV